MVGSGEMFYMPFYINEIMPGLMCMQRIKYSKNYDLSTFINLVKGINETLG